MDMAGLRKISSTASATRVIEIADYAGRRGEYALLSVALPGQPEESAGVLLLDPQNNQLYVKLRRDWAQFAADEDEEVLSRLESDLQGKAAEMGGEKALDDLEQAVSLTLRISGREAVTVRDFPFSLNQLYRQHVHARVLPFETHLPVYALEVAAGPFLSNPAEIAAEDWIEAPENLKLVPEMFVGRINGHSMEPKIPDGSWCVFRRGVTGSRRGRLVLVRNSELADENRYTVKRYTSDKIVTEDGFRHTRIRLESLNPKYPSWDLDPDEDKYQIVAEFVAVLP
jgi:SOS-response transcriptional repressor LexA